VSVVKVTQVRSTISQSDRHLGTLRALGLGRIGKTAEHEDSPQLRGMLRQVDHLVRIDGKDR
jgi:large subunit ribosomal protein L30